MSKPGGGVEHVFWEVQYPSDAARELVRRLGGVSAAGRALRGMLWHPDWEVRARAALTLGALDDPMAVESVPDLIRLAADRDPMLRRPAGSALGLIGPVAEKAIPRLIRNLADEIPDARAGAAQGLRGIGFRAPGIRDAIRPLIRSARDPDEVVRREALLALVRVNIVPDREVVAALLGGARDGAAGVRAAAAAAFSSLNCLWRNPAADEIAGLLGGLIRHDQDREVRGWAAIAIAGLDGPFAAAHLTERVIEALAGALRDDPDPAVRRAAVQGLLTLGAKAVAGTDSLSKALRGDVDADVREAAAEALSRAGQGAATAREALAYALKSDPNPVVRAAAAEGLAESGGATAEVVPDLLRLLRPGMPEGVRVRAASALAGVRPVPAAAVQALIETLRGGEATLQAAAAAALGRIGPSADRAVPDLLGAMVDPGAAVRGAATTALERVSPGHLARLRQGRAARAGWAGQANSPIDGIEIMGEAAFALTRALQRLRQIGTDCRQRGGDSFSFEKAAKTLDASAATLRNEFTALSDFFSRYFAEFEGIEVPADGDQGVDPGRKLFDRRAGVMPSIQPLGWRAWELACRFLERQERLAGSRARRRKT